MFWFLKTFSIDDEKVLLWSNFIFCENRLVVCIHILFLEFKGIKVEWVVLCPKMRSWWQCFQFFSSILSRILFMHMLVDPYCLIFLLFFMFYCERYFNVFHVLNIGLVNSLSSHRDTCMCYWDKPSFIETSSWKVLEISITFSRKG